MTSSDKSFKQKLQALRRRTMINMAADTVIAGGLLGPGISGLISLWVAVPFTVWAALAFAINAYHCQHAVKGLKIYKSNAIAAYILEMRAAFGDPK